MLQPRVAKFTQKMTKNLENLCEGFGTEKPQNSLWDCATSNAGSHGVLSEVAWVATASWTCSSRFVRTCSSRFVRTPLRTPATLSHEHPRSLDRGQQLEPGPSSDCPWYRLHRISCLYCCKTKSRILNWRVRENENNSGRPEKHNYLQRTSNLSEIPGCKCTQRQKQEKWSERRWCDALEMD